MGLAWIADGVFTTGTQIELTKVWSALAAYEHIWNPKWRTAVVGGYVNVDYSSAATNCILQHTPGALAACGVAPVLALLTFGDSLCSGQQLQPRLRASGKPIPAPSGTQSRSSISASKCSTQQRNTAFKGAAVVPANGSRPAVFALDDQNVWSAMFRWQRNFYP